MANGTLGIRAELAPLPEDPPLTAADMSRGRLDPVAHWIGQDRGEQRRLCRIETGGRDAEAVPTGGLGAVDVVAELGEVRYSSRMRALESSASFQRSSHASSPLRSQLRPGQRNRFFAVCWVMMLAPRTPSPQAL